MPIPGTKRTEWPEENIGAAEIELIDTQLSDLRVAADQVQIVGASYLKENDRIPTSRHHYGHN